MSIEHSNGGCTQSPMKLQAIILSPIEAYGRRDTRLKYSGAAGGLPYGSEWQIFVVCTDRGPFTHLRRSKST